MPVRAFLDTNVLIDYFVADRKYHQESVQILEWCYARLVYGFVSTQSIFDALYILRKGYNVSERKKMLTELSRFLQIVAVDEWKMLSALEDKDFVDAEDCLQYLCAKEMDVTYLVTGNATHFEYSGIPVVTPREFCEEMRRQW